MVARRATDRAVPESTPFSHKHLLRRPRTHERLSASQAIGLSAQEDDDTRVDDPAAEKRRFELFIDLIWVGVIGNLAESFSDEAFAEDSDITVGNAVWHFIVLFLMAWRFWRYLQEFMAKYSTNDLVERAFIIWALILAMLFGNNAPYLFAREGQSNIAIIIYLVWRGSVILIEIYYCLYIHHIRRRVMIQGIFIIPVLPVWIAAEYCRGEIKVGLAFAAINIDFYLQTLFDTPLVNRHLHELDQGEKIDSSHWTERIQDFYVIILGEGVLSLIRGSPLGKGITLRTSAGVLSLLAYYALSSFYFNGDQSRRYIHAVRRSYWRKNCWQLLHGALFGSTLIIGVTFVYLLEHATENAVKPDTEDEVAIKLAIVVYSAKWTISIALGFAMLNQTIIALLNKSLDPPGTLKVNNRYLRLLPRILIIPIVVALPADRKMNSLTYLGIISGLLVACLPWEWWSSLERSGGFVER